MILFRIVTLSMIIFGEGTNNIIIQTGMFVVELRQQIIIIIIIGTLSPSRPIDYYDEATSNNRRCPSAPSTQLLAMNTPVSLSLVVVCSSTK